VLNISGLRSSPTVTALTGVVLIVFGAAGDWPPPAIVEVLLLVLAALGFLTGTREPRRGVHRGLRSEGGGGTEERSG
jgi:MYXO-CTERM domain-containing protein